MARDFSVCIDLNDERDAYTISNPGELIHQRELREIKNHILSSYDKADKYPEKLKEKSPITRRHDTIMLSGGRGSGKTTLMLTLLEQIRNKNAGDAATEEGLTFANICPYIEVLDILDPTLIEDKGHIMLNIISRIKDKIDENINKSLDYGKKDSEDVINYRNWERSFENLAKGLPGLNGVGDDGFTKEDWLDSEFIVENGIRRVHEANHLEEYFHKYVNTSLKTLNKKAFILCFDDIDTDFKKGLPVLESLRKFITTPQVITILSGDMQLYSLLVRKQQWENLGTKLIEAENNIKPDHKENNTRFHSTVTQLEEQYFLKILKPERRVILNTLYQKEKSGKYDIKVKSKTDISLKSFYDEIFRKMGIDNGNLQNSFYQFISSQSIRTQKQLMFAFEKNEENLQKTVLDLFWSDLALKNIDVSVLNDNPEQIVIHLLNYLKTNKILNDGYTFRPIFDDEILNSTQFAAGVALSHQISTNQGKIFEYWLRIGLAREVGSLIPEPADGTTGNAKSDTVISLDNFLKHCGLLSGKSVRHIARMSTSYIRAIKRGSIESNPWHGTVPLYAFRKEQKEVEEQASKRFNYVIDKSDLDDIGKMVAYLPLSIATDHKGNDITVYSIFNLLGVVGEILEQLDLSGDKEKENVSKQRSLISNVLIRDAQPREYPIPGWINIQGNTYSEDSNLQEAGDDENEAKQTSTESIKKLAGNILEWYDAKPGKGFHPNLLAKIFTRNFYILNKMDEDLKKGKDKLSVWMHRMVVGFIHSVIIEEALDVYTSESEFPLTLTNPVTVDKYLVANLYKLSNLKNEDPEGLFKKLVLSKWIVACPLLHYFLQPNLSKELSLFCNKDFSDSSICDELAKVGVKIKKTSENKSPLPIEDIELIRSAIKGMGKNKSEILNKADSTVARYFLDYFNNKYSVSLRSANKIKEMINKGVI